jgi:hypothetical protein
MSLHNWSSDEPNEVQKFTVSIISSIDLMEGKQEMKAAKF